MRSLAIPRPRTQHGGGVAAHQKICQPHFPFQASEKQCCDGVAMRGFSSRCQLKSLRDERWRRPLSHRKRVEGGPPRPPTHHGGGRGEPENLPAAFSVSGVGKTMLRWRCDARVFKPLLIEIIARQKVAPAFEPQKVSRRTAPASECNAMDASGPAELSRCPCFQHEACGDHSLSKVV